MLRELSCNVSNEINASMINLFLIASLLLITGFFIWYLGKIKQLNRRKLERPINNKLHEQIDYSEKDELATNENNDIETPYVPEENTENIAPDGHNQVQNESPSREEFDKAPIYQTPETYPIWLEGEKDTDGIVGTTVRSDKGILEDFFLGFLLERFGSKVRTDLCIIVNSNKIIPDFCLYDESDQLQVVIEIDEPYSIGLNNSLMPVHVKGEDDRRNQLLLSAGWNILRFAEKQIALFPQECCDSIQLILNKRFHSLEEVNCWTREESLEMIHANYRNSYLPVEFTGQTRNNTNVSFISLPISFISMKKSKTGKEYFVIYYQNNGGETELSSIRESWIEKEQFPPIISSTKSFQSFSHKMSSNLERAIYASNLALKGSRIQGFGSINGRYLNFIIDSNLKILDTKESTNYTEKLLTIFQSNDPYKIMMLLTKEDI